MSINKLFVKTIAIAIVLLIANPTKAQIFSLGIKGGFTSSNLFTSLPSLGLTVGPSAEIKIINWLRLRTEANFMWSGTEKHFWEKDDTDYLSVGMPLMLNFMPFKNFHIGVGAELDYLFSAQETEIPSNRFNFGILANVEYRFFDRLGIGLRYVHNLGNFSQFQDFGESINNSSNSTSAPFPMGSVQMTLSYRFGK